MQTFKLYSELNYFDNQLQFYFTAKFTWTSRQPPNILESMYYQLYEDQMQCIIGMEQLREFDWIDKKKF